MNVEPRQDFAGFDTVFAPGLLKSKLAWDFQRLNYFLSRRVDLERFFWHGDSVIPDKVARTRLLDMAIYHAHWAVIHGGGHAYLEEVMQSFHAEMKKAKGK